VAGGGCGDAGIDADLAGDRRGGARGARLEFGDRVAATVSIGVAAAGQEGADISAAAQVESALRRADEARYRAKREGKNRVLPWLKAA
jgi:GGDEF domain-containing protein